jgi:hypothetical protein
MIMVALCKLVLNDNDIALFIFGTHVSGEITGRSLSLDVR